jgi:hypothetical protein
MILYSNLNPGGYLELFEITFPTVVDDNSWPPNSALKEWGNLIVTAAANIGRAANSAESFLPQLKEAGFEDPVVFKSRWPTNKWPKDAHMKELGMFSPLFPPMGVCCWWSWWVGMWNNENLSRDVSGLSLGVFTHGLGWTGDQVEAYLVNVRKEMNDTKIHSYYPM